MSCTPQALRVIAVTIAAIFGTLCGVEDVRRRGGVESGDRFKLVDDTLLLSTDFPHYDAIFPGSVAAMASRRDLTDAQKRKFLRDNALRFYGAKQ
jgi:hypothetical protein